MRYYIDLMILGFWIGIFISYIISPSNPVIATVTPLAFLCCITHGITTMFNHDLDNYMQKLSQQSQEDDKEDE